MRGQDGAFSRRFCQNIRRGGQVALNHRCDLLRLRIEAMRAKFIDNSLTSPAHAVIALLGGKQGQPAAKVRDCFPAIVIQYRGVTRLNVKKRRALRKALFRFPCEVVKNKRRFGVVAFVH